MRYEFNKPEKKEKSKSNSFLSYVTPIVVAGAFIFGGFKYLKNKAEGPSGLEKKVVQPVAEINEIEKPRLVAREKPNYEQRQEAEQKPEPQKKIIVLDPGHKGRVYKDPGTCHGDFIEAEIVFDQAKKVKELLEGKGYEVHLTKNNYNEDISLSSRVKAAEKLNADAFISLHCNGAKNTGAYGQLVVYGKGSEKESESKALGESIQKYLGPGIDGKYKVRDRGVKTDKQERGVNLKVLHSRVPSVIVEPGFLSNENDRGFLTDKIYDVENAIANGIIEYLGSK